MASLGEARVEVQRGVEAADQGGRAFREAVAEAEGAADLARTAVQGSIHPHVRKAAQLLAAAEREAGTAFARFDRTSREAEAYLRMLG